MKKVRDKKVKFFYSAVLLSFAADQASKYWMLQFLSQPPHSYNLFRYFSLTLVYNTGVSFGLFSGTDIRIPIIGASIVIAAIIFIYFHKLPAAGNKPPIALGLIQGGIIGNLADRITTGAVIDFINFHVWPVFNLADTFIVSGIALIFFKQLRAKPANAESGAEKNNSAADNCGR